MLKSEKVAGLFDEARVNSADSLLRLKDAEKHWDRRELLRAAEKAWAATTQATDALVLAYSGAEPASANGYGSDSHSSLLRLSKKFPELEGIVDQYTEFYVYLFDLVICNGNVDPLEYTVEDIRKTSDYIRDAERLAGVE